MDLEKLRSVVQYYKDHLIDMGVNPKEFTNEQYENPTTGYPLLQHCRWMLNKMEEYLHPDNVTTDLMNKSFRWIGYVQGSLGALQIFAVKQLRDHSRSPL